MLRKTVYSVGIYKERGLGQNPRAEANKEKILRACQIFKERGVNVAI